MIYQFLRSLSTSLLIFIAKHCASLPGLWNFCQIQFSICIICKNDLSADLLYPLVCEVVIHLECAGFRVISLTGDNTSITCSFVGCTSQTRVYYQCKNLYNRDQSSIHFSFCPSYSQDCKKLQVTFIWTQIKCVLWVGLSYSFSLY